MLSLAFSHSAPYPRDFLLVLCHAINYSFHTHFKIKKPPLGGLVWLTHCYGFTGPFVMPYKMDINAAKTG